MKLAQRTPQRLEQLVPGLTQLPGWHAYVGGTLAGALGAVRSVLRDDPDCGRAWELAGLIHRDLAKPLDAADAFERAALLVPLHPLSQLYLAECYGALRRRRLAKELYLEIAAVNGRDADILLLIAAGLEAIDEPHQAMQLCRRADAAEPNRGQTMYDMAYYAARCGASSTVLESLGWRAVELEPENVHFRIGLASLLVRLGKEAHAFFLVKRLTAEQLGQVTCVCCLRRMGELYARHGENMRLALVQDRLGRLATPERSQQSQAAKEGRKR